MFPLTEEQEAAVVPGSGVVLVERDGRREMGIGVIGVQQPLVTDPREEPAPVVARVEPDRFIEEDERLGEPALVGVLAAHQKRVAGVRQRGRRRPRGIPAGAGLVAEQAEEHGPLVAERRGMRDSP